MFGKGVHQEEEALLRDIVRSINKKIDYTAREGEGSRFSLHVSLRGHETDVLLDLEDLKAAKTDKVGDGKIFITDIDRVIRIRTGETDNSAL